ncbi:MULTISPECIES: type II toxin-antitoxin system RelE/ParE family toxin [unclassified Pseudomonas]|uniref:type II toxin-antitoxin system RelE/ParE family toxin n=1 Tax=unclassified Pseudomonas TaxID=196821 RepID=UPI000BA4A2DB|nr:MULTISPECIES: type II toxin-antitoxin system RelE/ParE family toxin [unclassified Pseudomonas]
MPRVALTEKAESDLDAIHEHYCGLIGSNAASHVVASILDTFDQLERFPGSGRPSQVPDVRELVLNQIPFVVPYRVTQGQVQVLRILHQRSERTQEW